MTFVIQQHYLFRERGGGVERENGVVKDTTPPAIVGCIVVVQPWQQIGDRRAHHALNRCGCFCLVQVSYEASTDNVTLLIIAQKQEKKQGDNDKETVYSRCCNHVADSLLLHEPYAPSKKCCTCGVFSADSTVAHTHGLAHPKQRSASNLTSNLSVFFLFFHFFFLNLP